jgi:8-oxo-dGTP diphosphatase
VAGDDDRWSARFPDLFRDEYVDYAPWIRVRFTTEAVPQELVSRLHPVAVTPGNEVVVCRSDQGWRFLPGGTREPAKSLADLARRELIAEAGAELTGEMRYFGAHVADSMRPEPFRPQLTRQRACWAYVVAPVEVIALPESPPDAEHVVEVLTLCGLQP